jgi:hypothetical protein
MDLRQNMKYWTVYGYNNNQVEIAQIKGTPDQSLEYAVERVVSMQGVKHVVVVPTYDRVSMVVGTVRIDDNGNDYVEWKDVRR